MTKAITRFWEWYNNVKEPWRIIFAIFVLCLPLYAAILSGYNFLMILMIPIIGTKMLHDTR